MAILSSTTSLDFSIYHVTAASVVIYIALYIFLYRANVPRNLPWVGVKAPGFFQEKKAAYSALSNLKTWLGDGYQKYGKLGKSFVLPGFDHKEIVIPNNKIPWLLEHDDRAVSVSAAHYDGLAGDYAWGDKLVLSHPYHEHVIHKNLARKMGNLIPNTWPELEYMVPLELGESTEWTDVTIMDRLQTIVSGISNRLFVGPPACRDRRFLRLCGQYANDIGLYIGLWAFVPPFLRPILGPLLAIPNNYHARQIRAYTLPMVKDRLAAFAYNDDHPESPKTLPEDYITWHIKQARSENNSLELQPEVICKRILPIEFAAMHTTTFTIVNMLLDLTSSDPSKDYISQLRAEAETVYAECNGNFDKAAIAKMTLADSALRESMRLSTFMTTSVQRKVVAAEGLKCESEGWTAPVNSMISANLWDTQHDPEIYPSPWTYEADRFVRAAKESINYLEGAKLSFVTTSETFLPFGHGKHACPGRFFVNQELKLILAYLLLNYDLAYVETRPKNVSIGPSVIPPASATMGIRKRVKTV